MARRPDVDVVGHLDTWEYGAIVDLLGDLAIDTVVHVGLVTGRHRSSVNEADTNSSSGALRATDGRVIQTMRLAAAVGRRDGPVRNFVVASSASVYPASSRSPMVHREHETLSPSPNSEAAALLEAEDYVRDVALANPHIAVAILRLCDLVGRGVTSSLASLLRAPFVPFIPGFDPSVQLLHVDDALAALEHAASTELAGLYNVAGEGTIRWRRAINAAGRWPWPVLPAALGSLSSVLRFGRCLDTDALSGTGFTAAHSSEQCARSAGRYSGVKRVAHPAMTSPTRSVPQISPATAAMREPLLS